MADWGNRSASGAGGSYGESQAASKAGDNIRQIQNLTKILNKWVKQVGTSKDNQQLRENMKQQRDTALALAQETQGLIHQLGDVESGGRNSKAKVQQQKLNTELQRTLNDFKATAQESLRKEKEHVLEMRRSGSFSGSEGGAGQGGGNWGYQTAEAFGGFGKKPGDKQSLLANDHLAEQQESQRRRQQQEQLANEMDFNEAIIEEREDGIREIEGQMAQVNEIFKDLALLVHEQGETIDTIAEQTDRTMSTTEKANAQLFKAKKYQKSYRSKMCCMTVVIMMIALALAILLVSGSGGNSNLLLAILGGPED